MTKQKSYNTCDDREYRTCKDTLEEVDHAFTNLLLLIGTMIVCVFITRLYYKFFFSTYYNLS
jgi:hypothetical protein